MNYLQNLQVLRQAVQDEPEQMLDLARWAAPASCGTLHCIAGLAVTLPYFKQLGMISDCDGAPNMYDVDDPDNTAGTFTTLNHFFGTYSYEDDDEVDAFDIIFSGFGSGDIDHLIYAQRPDRNNDLTHKKLALARLDWAIAYWEKK